MAGYEPGKLAEDEPSLNTPLDGGEGSLDTMTNIGVHEARVVEPFDPICSDVKEISTAVIGLAGSVKAALLKFQSVDARLEEFQTIPAGMQANMVRVDKYLSMVEQPVVTKAHPKGTASAVAIKSKGNAFEAKGGTQSKGPTASAAGIKAKGIALEAKGGSQSKGTIASWNSRSLRTNVLHDAGTID
ncbi:uncharacterized protein LOC130738367 [Lotus japonicus]|uniref:uncharacterized protein LOC130738367 n=1 Tax=Lotus japonicus TaxID=34305 RepID=UPI002586084F|nr:uncharacterized protein LOC130738367 [Lotus japonicus]